MDPEIERLSSLFASVGSEWESGDQNRLINQAGKAYYRFYEYHCSEAVRNRFVFFGSLLSCIENFDESTGCDLGCWLGFSTALQAAHGCRFVYGVDIRQEIVEEAERWSRKHSEKNVGFRPFHNGQIPLTSASVDWVLISHVHCNAPPGTFRRALREAFRILKTGGTLIFRDGNNPYCLETKSRLQKEFFASEIGQGTLDSPDGMNFISRCQLISQQAPEIREGDVKNLALGTCYMWGEEIAETVRNFISMGKLPESRFDPNSLRTPLLPTDGAANGNITDPFEICGLLEDIGFGRVDITVSPERQQLGNDELWDDLRSSMKVSVFADKLS